MTACRAGAASAAHPDVLGQETEQAEELWKLHPSEQEASLLGGANGARVLDLLG
jgi:hypothetical protein